MASPLLVNVAELLRRAGSIREIDRLDGTYIANQVIKWLEDNK